MLTMEYNGRRLSIRPTDRPGVSLDMFVNRRYVGSTRRGNSVEAYIAALQKLTVLVDRVDNARKPELYEPFWFDRAAA